MTPLLDFDMPNEITCAAMHPAGDKFVVGSRDFSVCVYSMDGKKLGNDFIYHILNNKY